jgi:ribosomal protein S18 acetylase RimI-like enzyme
MTPSDFAAVNTVLAEAFAADPLSRMLFGQDDPRPGLLRINRAAIRNPHGVGTLAVADNRIVGVMLEADSPKCEPDGLSGLRFMFDSILAMRWRMISAMSVFRGVAKHHPAWAHRHLNVIGVLPEFQGKGVGSKMLEDFCRRADEQGKACYLETDTEAARRLYERFGFHVVQQEKVKGGNFLFMWRPARSATR